MTRKIYLASSWRNEYHKDVLEALRNDGHEVHDYRDPAGYFRWNDVHPDADWKNWSPEQFKEALTHKQAFVGFNRDMQGLDGSNTCVLLLPSGRSAHIEAGYAIGKGKDTFILMPEKVEPELMYKMVPLKRIVLTTKDLLKQLRVGV